MRANGVDFSGSGQHRNARLQSKPAERDATFRGSCNQQRLTWRAAQKKAAMIKPACLAVSLEQHGADLASPLCATRGDVTSRQSASGGTPGTRPGGLAHIGPWPSADLQFEREICWREAQLPRCSTPTTRSRAKRTSKDKKLVQAVADMNAKLAAQMILGRSPVLKEMADK